MTSSDKIEPVPIVASGAATASGRHLALELVETLKLAVPIALTQLGQIAMMTTDLALIGRLGDAAVAGSSLASTVYFISFTFGMGLVSAAAQLAQRYLFGLAWGMTPALWFLAIRGFMGAVNRPEPGLWITLGAIPANAVLVYLLIHGAWGLPRLELFGAGLATTIVNFGMFLAGLWFCASRRPFRKYQIMGRIWRIDWTLMRQLMLVGAPISFAFLMEYGLFAAAALLMGLINTTALAAHQIALQVTAILFMVPFGIGMAATVRVGHAVGRNDPAAVKRAGLVAMWLGITIILALTLAVILARFAIARFFFGEAAESAGAVIELTATLLMVGATFFVAEDRKSTRLNSSHMSISYAVFCL